MPSQSGSHRRIDYGHAAHRDHAPEEPVHRAEAVVSIPADALAGRAPEHDRNGCKWCFLEPWRELYGAVEGLPRRASRDPIRLMKRMTGVITEELSRATVEYRPRHRTQGIYGA